MLLKKTYKNLYFQCKETVRSKQLKITSKTLSAYYFPNKVENHHSLESDVWIQVTAVSNYFNPTQQKCNYSMPDCLNVNDSINSTMFNN